MRIGLIKKLAVVVFLCSFGLHSAFAALTIEITEGVEDALPIAIVPFKWLGAGEPPTVISDVIKANLARTGLFAPMEEKNMLAKPYLPQHINYKNWRMLDIPNLVIGKVETTGPDTYSIDFRLYDVYREKLITGYRYGAKTAQLRQIAHKISDIIHEELLGIKGAFDTQIVYIKKFPNSDDKPYRLYLSDADTHNEQELLRHNLPLFSPTWSPDDSRIAFAMAGSYGQGIFVFDLSKGERPKRVTDHKYKASAPSWSPDGKKLAMQILKDGSSDIHIMNLATKKMERITRHWSIDAEPAWSPTGESIVFTSERGGSPQLYEYRFDSGKINRLTFDGRQNLRASFSPDGKLITFVHLSQINGYNIAVMDMSTKQMRILTDSRKGESEHESPSFAPNGGMVIYAANYAQKGKEGKKTGLVAVSVEGNVQQHFVDAGAGEVREPAWSSYLD